MGWTYRGVDVIIYTYHMINLIFGKLLDAHLLIVIEADHMNIYRIAFYTTLEQKEWVDKKALGGDKSMSQIIRLCVKYVMDMEESCGKDMYGEGRCPSHKKKQIGSVSLSEERKR